MKVGTDAVLLGAWCDVTMAGNALDVGTGCGVIALMLAQRNRSLVVDAIDIDRDSVEQAQVNFDNSPWGNRLTAMEADFNDIELPSKYDLIISNPPFFVNGILPPAKPRMNARHTQSLTYDNLLSRARVMLSDAGRIAIVTPADVREEILDICRGNELYINRLTEVYSLENARPKRLLWEISKRDSKLLHETLTIEKTPGEFTEEYKALCRDFYLKF